MADNYFPPTGHDLADINFQHIGAEINKIEIVDELPEPSAALYGHERMFNDPVIGTYPMVCLEAAESGSYTWSEYKGGVYDGVTGPLIMPVEDFIRVDNGDDNA